MKGAFATNAIGISLIKGIEFDKSGKFEPILISDLLQKEMKKGITGDWDVDMSVLMGANVANEGALAALGSATLSPRLAKGARMRTP